ncbi:polysaccharide deacetylase family protein [Sporosarcina beigongshangi]|uniref:polysaccharide deacetylase family protein n=1 Tax=Sporosarcina beigongshangi TaxID=2782538 RepID=UPI0019398326|nr:polysaccharide deacetylase family protein [Sporosarcina beigongshangi]
MKKRFLYILVMLVLFIVACSNEQKAVTPNDDNDAKLPDSEVVPEPEEEEIIEEQPIEEVIEPLYALNAVWAFEPISDANPKAVLLTIDDAPDKYALEMAKTLKELDAPAIFFVNGHFIDTEEEQARLKEIYEMGFPIGNHTKTHANLKQISEQQQKEEIQMVSDTVEQITGERPKFFRAPYGVNSDFSKAFVENDGMLLMNWTYGYDWEKQYMDATALADIMVNTELLRSGANLLMHDREWTADALKDIVEGLRTKGYELIDPATIQGVED